MINGRLKRNCFHRIEGKWRPIKALSLGLLLSRENRNQQRKDNDCVAYFWFVSYLASYNIWVMK